MKRTKKSHHELSKVIEELLLMNRELAFRELARDVGIRVGEKPSFNTIYKSLGLLPVKTRKVYSGANPKTAYSLDVYSLTTNKIKELETLLKSRRYDIDTSKRKDIRHRLEKLAQILER